VGREQAWASGEKPKAKVAKKNRASLDKIRNNQHWDDLDPDYPSTEP